MKKGLLGFVGFSVLWLFVSQCGNPPPTEFFAGNSDDSLSILSFRDTTSVFALTFFEDSILSLDSVAKMNLWRYARAGTDRSQAKFLTVGFGRKVIPDSFFIRDSLLFIKDTTATLILRRDFVGELSLRICSITPYDADSGIYETYFLGKDTVLKKRFTGSTWEWGHFEPVKKDTEPRVWRLVKVTGCQVVSIPNEENSPIIPYPAVLMTPGRVDSVFPIAYYRDSTKFGDRRLFYYLDTSCLKKDSLLFLSGGQKLTASVTPWMNPDDTTLRFLHCGERKSTSVGVILPEFPSPTFKRIYLDVVTCEALTYEKKDYRGIIWGVGTKIK